MVTQGLDTRAAERLLDRMIELQRHYEGFHAGLAALLPGAS